MLHFFITVGLKPNGKHKVLIYPEDDTSGGHRGVNATKGEDVHWTVLNTTDSLVKVKVYIISRTTSVMIRWI